MRTMKSMAMEQTQTYLEGVFGPGVGRQEASEIAAGLRAGDTPVVDRADGDFFSAKAFKELILYKVVDEHGRRVNDLLSDDEDEADIANVFVGNQPPEYSAIGTEFVGPGREEES